MSETIIPLDERTVASRSGASLSVFLAGAGAPIVFVHGTASDASSWMPVLEFLTADHLCVRYDRAGRKGSTDHDNHSLEGEVDDLVAVIGAAGDRTPVHVVSHSFGALVGLQTALQHPNLFASLVCYEAPAPFEDVQFFEQSKVDGMAEKLRKDGPDAAVRYFMANFPRLPPDAIDRLRAAPFWQDRVASAHTIERELMCAAGFQSDALKTMPPELPVLLFLGESSPKPFHDSAERLVSILPRARVVPLSGQGHRGMDAMPDFMARTMREFFDDR